MMKFVLGMVVGYTAREEIRTGVKLAVKSLMRVGREVHGAYAAVKEDITDAIVEERASRQESQSPAPKAAPTTAPASDDKNPFVN